MRRIVEFYEEIRAAGRESELDFNEKTSRSWVKLAKEIVSSNFKQENIQWEQGFSLSSYYRHRYFKKKNSDFLLACFFQKRKRRINWLIFLLCKASIEQKIQATRKYLISMTLKDCSFFLTFKLLDKSEKVSSQIPETSHQYFEFGNFSEHIKEASFHSKNGLQFRLAYKLRGLLLLFYHLITPFFFLFFFLILLLSLFIGHWTNPQSVWFNTKNKKSLI